ncbi:uncharacterized protein Dere_GG17568 [Drosophila erecta]|uniref:DUF4729 domain-containing protein n=1 Tax=Drosophila erecta TaxID=7220 RepID=B3NY49_DROER|nr:uncharacterized protein Dere_GG17568 [Drosophila erecta]
MGKKFCYSEKNTHARIEKKQNRQGAQNSQLEKGQDAEEKEDDGGADMDPGHSAKPPQKLGVLKNLANGYLKLVHEIEAHLCLPAPPLIEAKPEREVGGEIARNFQSEEEMSQSSEDTTHPGIGFVDLYRRSLYFECLGIPLTSLELFSMECQKNEELEGRVMGGYRAGTEGLDERLTKETEWVAERNLSNRADYHPPKRRNTLENTSKSILFSGKPTKRKPVEHKPVETDLDDETEALLDDEHGSQYSRMELYQHSPKFQSRSSWEYTRNTFRLHGGFTPKPLEVFGVAHAPNAVESSSVEVSGKRLEERKKSCLKKSNRPVAESDFETMEPLRSNDTFTEAWKNSNFNRGQHHQDLRIGGLYSRAEKLKYQPIDRVDAGCSGVPLFKDSDESLERTRYFVSEFDKLSRAERMQDIELRIGQLRWLQAMSDKEYRQRFRKKRIAFKPVLANSMPHACPLNHDECPAVLNDTLLGHFVSRHLDEPGKELREIFEGEQVLMIFSPRAFQPGKTECMSVLGYGGVRNKPCTLPAVRFMPTRNTDLPEPYAHFDAHLPLLVMICRIRLSSVEGRKLRFGGPRLEDEDSLALWLVSRDLPCPIHVVMTVLNRRLDITRSSIMKVRELHKSHDPLDFMLSSKNYMRLSDHDLRVLTNDHTEPIYMEIVVKEYAGIFPRHIPDHFQGVA